MDNWPVEGRNRSRRENPSFSSTLLDAIYRSIDEPDAGKAEEKLIFYREMRKKISTEKSASGRRKSTAEVDSGLFNSSSSSSDSSSGGGFSSSESDSFYGAKSRSASYTEGYTAQRPKPIRTSVASWDERHAPPQFEKPKREGGFVRTKSKALKIYSDLKKVKQPISPGGRLANFLNSLFTAGNPKKPKISTSGYSGGGQIKTKTPTTSSTCSSASSFSRSCLSKTPSSRGNNTSKRSVRFYPVSVIVDEDCRPCGHKNLHETESDNKTTNSINIDLEFRIMEENRRVVEAAKELLKNYHKKKEEFDLNSDEVEFSDAEDDDAASCASSDLFELDHLSGIGIERYREELPVYETTNLGINRGIANGLIV